MKSQVAARTGAEQLEQRTALLDNESYQLISQQKQKINSITEQMQRTQADADRQLMGLELRLN